MGYSDIMGTVIQTNTAAAIVKPEVVLNQDQLAAVQRLETVDLSSVSKIGSSTQEHINAEMTKLIAHYSIVETGEMGEQLTELALTAKRETRKITSKGPFLSVQKFMGRFDTVENKLNQLTANIDESRDGLATVLDNMIASRNCMTKGVAEFIGYEQVLQEYISRHNSDEEINEPKVRAVISRLKILTTSRAVAEQSLVESIILIGQTQEMQQQMEELSGNVLPIFKMSLVNALSVKMHAEALNIKKKVTQVAEKLIIDNAKGIESNMDRMLEARRSSTINPQVLLEANETLQRVVSKTIESCNTENAANIEVINRLNSASSRLMALTKEINVTLPATR